MIYEANKLEEQLHHLPTVVNYEKMTDSLCMPAVKRHES